MLTPRSEEGFPWDKNRAEVLSVHSAVVANVTVATEPEKVDIKERNLSPYSLLFSLVAGEIVLLI